MAIDLHDLLTLRPIAYHTSGRLNFESIRDSAALISARCLLRATEQEHLLTGLRSLSSEVQVASRTVLIPDQRPIRPGSLQLEPDTTMQDYVDELNRRVFFWPGTHCGPLRQGRRHFELYRRRGELFVIRMPLQSLILANPHRELFVAKCNSGAARHHSGRPVERGPNTFRRLRQALFPASSAVELSFLQSTALPADAEFSESLEGPWRLLRPAS